MDYFDDNSKPSHLIGRSSYLFGNIKIIYEQSLIFYDELLKCNYDWKRVAETFVKHVTIIIYQLSFIKCNIIISF